MEEHKEHSEKNFFSFDRLEKVQIKTWLTIITYCLVLVYVILNMSNLVKALTTFGKILSPFIIGFVIAYIVNKPLQMVQNKLLKNMANSKSTKVQKMRKPVAVLITYLLMIGLIVTFFSIVIPQLVVSATALANTIYKYSGSVDGFIQEIATKYNLNSELWNELSKVWREISQAIGNIIATVVPSIVNFLTSLTSGIAKAFLGIIVSIYMLLDKDKLIRQVKRLVYALLPKKVADKSVDITRLTNKTFGNFIMGQITVAFILGLLCFICMSILRMPFALIISVIVGVSNIIPYFGPFLGAIPGTFILITTSPMQAIFFVVLVIILQQVDNNFISPKIVGGNLGLSGIWVLFAITVGGGIFGIMGMVIGAPMFAVIYTLLGEFIKERLKTKNITVK